MKLIVAILLAVVTSIQGEQAVAATCLDDVAAFAIRICGDIAISGTSTVVDGNGNIDASISNIIQKVVGGASSSINGHVLYDTYVGVARDQLAGVHFSDLDCRQKMVNIAVAQVCQTAKSEATPDPENIPNPAAASHLGGTLRVEAGLGEEARLIARELGNQFETAGRVLDPKWPTVTYIVEAEPRTVGRSLDGPDEVVVTVTERATDPNLRLPAVLVKREYPWRNPNSSARNVAEQLYSLLSSSVRNETSR